MFVSTKEGFWITFPNGITVSVQISGLHYCSAEKVSDHWESPDAEIAIYTGNEAGIGWLTKEFASECYNLEIDDDVIGRTDTAVVAKAIEWAAKQ